MNKKILFLASSLLFLTLACKKLGFDKIASTAWNPNLAIPLAYGTFDIYNIFEYHDSSELVVVDPNTGLIALMYRSDLVVATTEDFVSLNQFNQSLLLDGSTLNIPATGSLNGTVKLTNQQNLTVDVPAGVEIHSLHLKSGLLAVTVSTDLPHNVTSMITLPGVTVGGSPIQQIVQLNYQGSVPHSGTAIFNIGGATMDCSVGNTTSNTVQVNIQNTITGSGAPITGNEFININFVSTNTAFDLAYGYFGQQSVLNIQDSILIKLFDSGEGNGYFELTDPRLRLFIDNSIGVPIRLTLSNLKTISTFNNQEFFMANYPAIHDINFPAILGVVVQTILEFNTSNTPNIANVIAPVPQYLSFTLSALTNPNGPGANLNFIRDTSKVKVRSELEMPLIGFAHGFGFKDTFNFNLGVNANEIESVMFRLVFDNGFPVKINSQITFLDENYIPLFTAWDQPVFAVDAGLTNSEGVVYQRTVKITDMTVDGDNLNLLKQAKYVEVHATAKTLNALTGNIIKIFDWYTIKMKLGMQIQAKISL